MSYYEHPEVIPEGLWFRMAGLDAKGQQLSLRESC
jgi:hypothetical protein